MDNKSKTENKKENDILGKQKVKQKTSKGKLVYMDDRNGHFKNLYNETTSEKYFLQMLLEGIVSAPISLKLKLALYILSGKLYNLNLDTLRDKISKF